MPIKLPNVRRAFIPDPGYIICDVDLDRADAQVVAWEADDPILKQMFREGVDIHTENAREIFNNPHLTDKSPQRHLAKAGVHAVNYGVRERTLAATLGITVREAETFRNKWLDIHPAIARWHDEIEREMMTTRTVTNVWGFKRRFLSRIDNRTFNEALAWKPQSTVGTVINKGWENVEKNIPEVEVLLQVHDSLVMQYPARLHPYILSDIRREMLIEIPYADPLIIPVGAKTSRKSWGDCVATPWPKAA